MDKRRYWLGVCENQRLKTLGSEKPQASAISTIFLFDGKQLTKIGHIENVFINSQSFRGV